MGLNIEALIWSIYKIKGKLPQVKDYDTSYNVTEDEFKDAINKIKKNRKQLKHLKTLPVVVQRSDEWFDMRKNMLTASDTYNAIIKSKTFISKVRIKCPNNKT